MGRWLAPADREEEEDGEEDDEEEDEEDEETEEETDWLLFGLATTDADDEAGDC